MKILVLDDEIFVAMEIGDLVESLGHEVVGPVTNVIDAQAVTAAEPVDMALLDVNLGSNLTSAPVAERLQAAGVPIIYVTATNPRDIPFRREHEPVIRKPLSRHDVARAIITVARAGSSPIS